MARLAAAATYEGCPIALAWILKGAKLAGLKLDTARGTRIDGSNPDWRAPLVNMKHPTFSPTQLVHTDRAGPEHVWQMSTSAVRRWQTPGAQLPDGEPYRPKTLARVEAELESLPAWTFEPPTDLIATEIVKSGDTLGAYAAHYYGDVKQYPALFEANRDVVEDPDDLFDGQAIRIPRLRVAPPAGAVEETARNDASQA